jgi:hypothetical protein
MKILASLAIALKPFQPDQALKVAIKWKGMDFKTRNKER